MTRRPKLRARAGTPLRDAVLRGAIELADRSGLEALTMRKLADRLGVEAMSLYNHVQSKEDLLDGMVDLVFGEIGVPPTAGDWRSALRDRAVRTRDALTRHRWAIGLMESRGRPGSSTLRHHDAVLGRLRRAGFSVAKAVHAYSLLDSYTYGFALTQLNLPYRTPEEGMKVADALIEQVPRDEMPFLAEMLADYAKRPGYAYASEFEVGLDLLLVALERYRRSSPEPARARRTTSRAKPRRRARASATAS